MGEVMTQFFPQVIRAVMEGKLPASTIHPDAPPSPRGASENAPVAAHNALGASEDPVVVYGDDEALWFHLAGKHDQRTHGRGGGRSSGSGKSGGATADSGKSGGPSGFLSPDQATPEEYKAIMDYSGNGFVGVNSALRKGTTPRPEDQATIDGLDSAFQRSALPEDTVVYRGISSAFQDHEVAQANQWINEWTDVERQAQLDEWGGAPPLKDIPLTDLFPQSVIDWVTPGTVMEDKGFMSTTGGQNMALSFGSQVLVRGTVKKGTPALRPGAYRTHLPNGKWNFEDEYLLPRGMKTKLLGMKQETGIVPGYPDKKVWIADVEFIYDE